MAQVALKREIQAYNQALADYQRDAQRHDRQAKAFNESFLTDGSGNKYIYEKPYQDVGVVINYVFDPFFQAYMPVVVHQPFTAGGNYYLADAGGKLTPTTAPSGKYKLEDLSGNYQTLRINPNEQGQYPTKPEDWTRTFDLNKPAPTATQARKLDEPSLADIERNQPSGLINSVFNP